MYRLNDDGVVLSASDLVNNLECEHLTWLDSERTLGRLEAEPKRPDTAVLLSQKGDEHERRYLELEERAEPGCPYCSRWPREDDKPSAGLEVA